MKKGWIAGIVVTSAVVGPEVLSQESIGTTAAPAARSEVAAPIVRSTGSGPWSAAATWEGGRVPRAGDRVQIRAGDRVVYDVWSPDAIRSIHVAGALAFAPDRDTRLDVGLIRVQACDDVSEEGFECDAAPPPAGAEAARPVLEVGTEQRPIDADHSAWIRLVFFEGMDPKSCPAIVCCGGRMEFHGTPMNRTWVKLGRTAAAGATAVELAEPVTGWQVGDDLLVTATERDRGRSDRSPGVGMTPDYGADAAPAVAAAVSDEPLTEERTIRAIEGTTVTLDRPLAHHHLAAGGLRGEVADLSRNVIVESADPDGVRGHTMYHRGSAGSISYAEFLDLGKRGVLGRYPVHFHRVRDTMRGSYVLGASVRNSDNRFLTIHGTDYLVVRDCVGYGCRGHGYYLEDGTEVDNVLDRNLAVGASAANPLPDQALPFDHNEGAGFWWANSRNSFTRNVACDCGRYGFRFEASPEGGFDLRLPVRQPDGREEKVDVRTLPFVRFDDNEAHAVAYGLNLGEEGQDRHRRPDVHSGVGPDSRHPFVIRDLKVWNARWAIRPESPSLLVDGLDIESCVYGFYRAKFVRHAYRDVRMTGTLLPEAFSQHVADSGFSLPQSGNDAFARTGAVLSAEEKRRFAPVLGRPSAELSPGDAERLVRASYNTGGRIDGQALPRLYEDPAVAGSEGVDCGPLAAAARLDPPDPVDDLPPATVITSIVPSGRGRLLVRGVTSDDGEVEEVDVNGHAAKPLASNFSAWEVELSGLKGGAIDVVATSKDRAGNVELTPHHRSTLVVD